MVNTLCLWKDVEGRICALSPDRFERWIGVKAPENPPEKEQLRANGIDAAGFLPEPLWRWLSAYFNEVSIELLLDRSLPSAWHKLAWEQLNWRGRKLGECVSVCRHATVTEQCLPAIGDTLIWDQWPGPEFASLWQRHGIERRRKRSQIEQDLQRGRDVGHFARLIVLAHGGENQSAPLLDRDGQPWPIAWPATLPPEVYLIACASYDGNLHDLAAACLERGAQTVVCGHGKLDAKQMAAALSLFLDAGQTPCQTLRNLQAQDMPRQPGGVQCLRGYGSVSLSPCDRLTLAFYQRSGGNPFTTLSRQLEKEGSRAISDFLTTVANPANGFWPLTQSWLLPLAAYWAEKHDHALMQKLKIRLAAPMPGAEALRPVRAYGLASLYRRD